MPPCFIRVNSPVAGLPICVSCPRPLEFLIPLLLLFEYEFNHTITQRARCLCPLLLLGVHFLPCFMLQTAVAILLAAYLQPIPSGASGSVLTRAAAFSQICYLRITGRRILSFPNPFRPAGARHTSTNMDLQHTTCQYQLCSCLRRALTQALQMIRLITHLTTMHHNSRCTCLKSRPVSFPMCSKTYHLILETPYWQVTTYIDLMPKTSTFQLQPWLFPRPGGDSSSHQVTFQQPTLHIRLYIHTQGSERFSKEPWQVSVSHYVTNVRFPFCRVVAS